MTGGGFVRDEGMGTAGQIPPRPPLRKGGVQWVSPAHPLYPPQPFPPFVKGGRGDFSPVSLSARAILPVPVPVPVLALTP